MLNHKEISEAFARSSQIELIDYIETKDSPRVKLSILGRELLFELEESDTIQTIFDRAKQLAIEKVQRKISFTTSELERLNEQLKKLSQIRF